MYSHCYICSLIIDHRVDHRQIIALFEVSTTALFRVRDALTYSDDVPTFDFMIGRKIICIVRRITDTGTDHDIHCFDTHNDLEARLPHYFHNMGVYFLHSTTTMGWTLFSNPQMQTWREWGSPVWIRQSFFTLTGNHHDNGNLIRWRVYTCRQPSSYNFHNHVS